MLGLCFCDDGQINNEEFEKIVGKYHKIILRYVKTYYLPGGDYRDMYQWGLIGLYKAVLYYDERRGKSFRLIAELNIKNTIKSAITSHNRKKHYILNEALSLNVLADSPNTNSQLESVIQINKCYQDDPAALVVEQETVENINQELKTVLSKLEKRVIDLYIEGYKQREISLILGLNEKVVDNAIQRVRQKLGVRVGFRKYRHKSKKISRMHSNELSLNAQ